MAKKILVLLGHPRPASLCAALAEAYEKGAKGAGALTRLVRTSDLHFDHVTPDYKAQATLEPDLATVQEAIKWAEHIALIYPSWWGGAPGPFKALLERVLLPGFAFKYHDKGQGWDRLLAGRTGELIVTMDTPPSIYRLVFGAAGDRVMARRTLDFCGVKPVRATHVGPVRNSSDGQRTAWIDRCLALGQRAAA